MDTVAGGRTEVLKALADPIRWSLLEHLSREPEVARKALHEGLGLTETALTYHLRILEGAGLVTIRKRGRNRYCVASRAALEALERAVRTLMPPLAAAATDPAPATSPGTASMLVSTRR